MQIIIAFYLDGGPFESLIKFVRDQDIVKVYLENEETMRIRTVDLTDVS